MRESLIGGGPRLNSMACIDMLRQTIRPLLQDQVRPEENHSIPRRGSIAGEIRFVIA